MAHCTQLTEANSQSNVTCNYKNLTNDPILAHSTQLIEANSQSNVTCNYKNLTNDPILAHRTQLIEANSQSNVTCNCKISLMIQYWLTVHNSLRLIDNLM